MRPVLLGLLVAGTLLGQASTFDRLKIEAARVKALPSDDGNRDQHASAVSALHAALRDWIESQLPQEGTTQAELRNLEAMLQSKLQDGGLNVPDRPEPADTGTPEGPDTGYVEFEFRWLPELPNSLFVVAGVAEECGSDQAVYLYQFQADGWTRAFEDHPKSTWGYTEAKLEVSDADSQGRRLLLVHYWSVQCASFWMGMAYSVYRLGVQPGASELLLASKHSFWLGNDGPEFVLKPQELIIEFLDSSVDASVHNRTNIQRYDFAEDVRRVDPVALQPQDFAEEWLTRPWSEMQSRSAVDTKDWHERLHGDYVGADYSGVIPCASPGRWLVALDISRIGRKELPEPSTTYFLVRDSGNYHYSMEAISASRPAACLGAGFASDKHPWLSPAELKALR